MAQALVEWAVRDSHDRVLDPSFGGLVFLDAARARLARLGAAQPAIQLYGVDVDEDALDGARSLAAEGARLTHGNFLQFDADNGMVPKVEAVVGNPPYVRYQFHDRT